MKPSFNFHAQNLLSVHRPSTMSGFVAPEGPQARRDAIRAEGRELANEESLMQDYTKYCDSEANAREDAITAGKRTSTDLQATIQDSTAATQGLTAEIDDLAAKIRTGDADLQAATKVREQERESFEAREKELSETLNRVDRQIGRASCRERV